METSGLDPEITICKMFYLLNYVPIKHENSIKDKLTSSEL
jgi:hypothetical protein